jgi:hypothetical protein
VVFVSFLLLAKFTCPEFKIFIKGFMLHNPS